MLQAYLDAQLAAAGGAVAVDVTAAYAMLTVQGPRSRAVLAAVAPEEVRSCIARSGKL